LPEPGAILRADPNDDRSAQFMSAVKAMGSITAEEFEAIARRHPRAAPVSICAAATGCGWRSTAAS
jgi:hypothetical protein